MSRPRFIQALDAPQGSKARLNPENSRIALKVLRLRPGDTVEVLDGRGTLSNAEIIDMGRDGVFVRVLEVLLSPAPVPVVTLWQGFPKGDVSDRIVQRAVEWGIQRVVFVLSDFAVVRRANGRKDRWKATVFESMRQSGNPYPTVVDGPIPMSGLRDEVQGAFRLFFDLSGAELAFRHLASSARPPSVDAAVGPEGGWSDSDREAFLALGFRTLSLGPGILRCETAAVSAMALVRSAFQSSKPGRAGTQTWE